MQETNQQLKNREFWQQKVLEARKYAGPETEFCKEQGLNNTTFKNWKHRFSKGLMTKSKSAANKSVSKNSFVSVQVQREVLRPRTLPDAKWVAELILHLQGVIK